MCMHYQEFSTLHSTVSLIEQQTSRDCAQWYYLTFLVHIWYYLVTALKILSFLPSNKCNFPYSIICGPWFMSSHFISKIWSNLHRSNQNQIFMWQMLSPFSINIILLDYCPVGWGYRIHQLFLCRGVRPPKWVTWIWHSTIWWWCSSNAGVLGNADYPFIAITPRSTLTWSSSIW